MSIEIVGLALKCQKVQYIMVMQKMRTSEIVTGSFGKEVLICH